MKRTSRVLLRVITLLLIAFEAAGCVSFGNRETLQAEARAFEKTTRDAYFSDWDAAVKAAYGALERDPEGSVVAHFVAGEALYLAGDHEAAVPHLLAALRGQDPLVALAALHIIRDLYVSRPLAIELSRTDPVCATALCRAVINAEAIEWARATKRPWDARRQEGRLHWSPTFRLFRAAGASAFRDLATVAAEEEAYRAGKPFVPSDARLVELPETGTSFDLHNYFSPVRNAVFFASGAVTLPEGGAVTILPYITVPFRLYVDGKVVLERDADRLSVGVIAGAARIELTKGTHTILLKLAPYLSDDGYASVLFFNDGLADTAAEGEDIAAAHDGDDPLSAYLRLLTRDLLFADSGIADWEGFYASVNGSRSPGPLFQTARNYRRAGNDQSAGSVLSFVTGERPGLILLKSELIEIYQDLGDDAGVRRVIDSEEGNARTELPWLLRLADLYFAKKWQAADIKNAEELIDRYELHPVAHYYLSDSWHGMGDIDKAARIRQRAVRLMPGYQPTLSRLAELYREASDLSGLIRTAKQSMDLDPHNIDLSRMLGEAYISDGSWGKAVRVFTAALDRNPESAELWARRGDALLLDGERDAATASFRRAYELAPESLEYADRLDSVGAASSDFFVKQAQGDAAVDKKIADFRANAAKYPQKYTIIYDEGIQQVHYSGSVRSRFRMTIALNTEEGVREFSTVANYGRILSARVVKSDGRALPGWRADAGNLYFLDTVPGDVIDFVMESSEGPRSWIGGTDFRWFFASEGVYNLHSRIVLRFPKDMSVLFHVRGPAKEVKTEEAGAVTHTFEAFGLTQPPREEGMPPFIDELPLLSYTTVRSWDDFSRWQAVFIREQSEGAPDMERRVMELVQGLAGTEKRVEALRDWVARQVRYLAADDVGIAKVKPEKTTKTFAEKAGDCKDKVLLLKQLFSYAGIRSQYALVKSRRFGSLIRELPSMQFDHALLYIPPQTGVETGYFVDATSSYDNYRGINPELELTDAFVIDEQNGTHEFVPVVSGLRNTVSLTIAENGAAQLKLTGSAASNGRYRFAVDSDPFSYFSGLIAKMAGTPAEVSQCALSTGQYAEPLEVSCAVGPFFPTLAAFVLGRTVEAQERHYGIYLGDRVSSWSAFIRGIPALVAPVSVENEFFVWRAAPAEGGVSVSLELLTTVVAPQNYGAFRAAVAKAIEEENKQRGAAQ